MTFAFQILAVLGAIVLGFWGANYLSHSISTNSAIHEIAGMLGLGMAAILIGLVMGLGYLSRLTRRVRDLEDLVVRHAGPSRLVQDAAAYLDAMVVLVSLSEAADDSSRHREIRLAYLRKALSVGRLDDLEEADLTRWMDVVPRTTEAIANAIKRVNGLPERQFRMVKAAADDIVKASGGKLAPEKQRRLHEYVGAGRA